MEGATRPDILGTECLEIELNPHSGEFVFLTGTRPACRCSNAMIRCTCCTNMRPNRRSLKGILLEELKQVIHTTNCIWLESCTLLHVADAQINRTVIKGILIE